MVAVLAVGTLVAGVASSLVNTSDSAIGPPTHVLTAPPGAHATSSLLDAPSAVAVGSGAERELAGAADHAARELAGARSISPVSFDRLTGLWDRVKFPRHTPSSWRPPTWWQSALALRALARYLEFTGDASPAYQRLISAVYRLNITKPGTLEPSKFENAFMDDTAWWGLAWLAAARYEHDVRHDRAAAARYLRLAEEIASHVYRQPRRCGGGIEFRAGFAPNTVTNAEFVSLAAQLAQARSHPGPLHNPGKARGWLAKAARILTWVRHSGLINLRAGTVVSTDDGHCRPEGPAKMYMVGETADALTQMGAATHDRAYYAQAALFLHRVLDRPSPMLAGGVLQEPCEAQRSLCAHQLYNITVYKGLLVDAVFDWSRITGATLYDGFLLAQARAVLAHAASNGRATRHCQTPTACQLSLYWARPVPVRHAPIPLTPGTQTAGLSALSDALAVTRTAGTRAVGRSPAGARLTKGCACASLRKPLNSMALKRLGRPAERAHSSGAG